MSSNKVVNRVGEKRMMNCGLEAEIISYINSKNIDVKFSDGNIRKNVTYSNFKKGLLRSKVVSSKDYLGRKNVMNCGLEAEIINYNGTYDIDIRFEDGTVRRHVSYRNFIRGKVSKVKHSHNSKSFSRVGEKRLMNCGIEAEIVKYRDSNDIDIKFKTGELRTNIKYNSFIRGIVRPKKIDKCYNGLSRVGEKKVMNCDMIAEIIEYRNCDDIDVLFEDGTKRCGVSYYTFKTGKLSNKGIISNKSYGNLIGTKILLLSGIEVELISCEDYKNIYVKFSDGYIKRIKSIKDFKRKSIPHFSLRLRYDVLKGSTFSDFDVTKLAYRQNDGNVYYICKCQKCGMRDILNPQEMVSHRCQN